MGSENSALETSQDMMRIRTFILKNSDQYSYDKSIAIAAHHFSSECGERDDAGQHEFGQSKITNFMYSRANLSRYFLANVADSFVF